jgi:hypothetical protein
MRFLERFDTDCFQVFQQLKRPWHMILHDMVGQSKLHGHEGDDPQKLFAGILKIGITHFVTVLPIRKK